jgi:MFS family permease
VTQLILARALQGVGAALLIPSALAIIGATFAENERGKAIGAWAGFSALAAAAEKRIISFVCSGYPAFDRRGAHPARSLAACLTPPALNQRSTFDELKKTTQSATEQLRSSCPSAVPLSPVARVDTATTGLWQTQLNRFARRSITSTLH